MKTLVFEIEPSPQRHVTWLSMRDEPAIRAFSRELSLEQALRHARLTGGLTFLYEAARAEFLRQTAQERGFRVTDERLQQAADNFRQGKRLLTVGALEAWLAENHMTQLDFEEFIEFLVIEEWVRDNVAATELEVASERSSKQEQRMVSRIRVKDQGLAAQIYLSIIDGDESFAALAARFSEDGLSSPGGYLGPIAFSNVPAEARVVLQNAQPGEVLAPVQDQGYWTILRCDAVLEAREPGSKLERWVKAHQGEVKLLVGTPKRSADSSATLTPANPGNQ